MQSTSILCAAALLLMGASAHGNITSPPARLPGPAMAAACGAQAVASVEADGTIPLESVSAASAACKSAFTNKKHVSR
jgi:predicted carbohydrate-binding protein with CBM5 and CBM33 domain